VAAVRLQLVGLGLDEVGECGDEWRGRGVLGEGGCGLSLPLLCGSETVLGPGFLSLDATADVIEGWIILV
jgi:hypothetical protein